MIELFTRQERIVLLFLVFGVVVGAAIKLFKPEYKSAAVARKAHEEFQRHIEAMTTSQNQLKSLQNAKKPAAQKGAYDFKININTASVDEIVRLPKVGPVLASRIVKYREQNGYFQTPEELIKVKGIGKKTLEKLKPFIFVTPME
ncbi:MAG: helix-hairpin-helix domain-containing protein [Calditrichaeota bacterium]|nr:helix-hairpin-helix domain-containing protein [Calditrichota bacterium]